MILELNKLVFVANEGFRCVLLCTKKEGSNHGLMNVFMLPPMFKIKGKGSTWGFLMTSKWNWLTVST